MALEITVHGFADGERIPDPNCFGNPGEPMEMGANRSPSVTWSGAPDATRSFALLVVDPDVPSVGDDVNVEGRVIPASLPRVDFYHWVLVDIPAGTTELAEGASSDGVTPRGKAPGARPFGVEGINGYTGFMAGDPDMAGTYGGYDGPCPPWNDELLHHYHFRLFALDVDSLGLSGEFSGEDAVAAMEGHVLAEASQMGTYTLFAGLLG
ncbi:MAG: YbhB/YbcL family Raf kinase inhibitor-like protein [Acidimicrobiales bacterium]|nr:YbhB/YbcL family Raf kinase inhibitor-like protein [Acidimicrobiales bacterium]